MLKATNIWSEARDEVILLCEYRSKKQRFHPESSFFERLHVSQRSEFRKMEVPRDIDIDKLTERGDIYLYVGKSQSCRSGVREEYVKNVSG